MSSKRDDSSSSAAAWEHSDIRGDVDAGWGGGGGVPAAAAAAVGNNDNDHHGSDTWGWKLHQQALRPVNPFMPLDPLMTRRLFLNNKEEIEEISLRISSACQHLSVHVNWDDVCPSATLVSMERVEMAISVYWGAAIGNEGRTFSSSYFGDALPLSFFSHPMLFRIFLFTTNSQLFL